MTFRIHDVRGDGHCFFRSVAQAMLSHSNSPPEKEDELVKGLRSTLAEGARRRHRARVSRMIANALATCVSGVDCFLDSTPIDLLQRARKNVGHLEYADVLEKTNAYASFIEVELMRLFLRKRGVALVVVPSIDSLRSKRDWAATLSRIERRKKKLPRAMILLNSGGSHYMWVSFDSSAICRVGDIRDALLKD